MEYRLWCLEKCSQRRIINYVTGNKPQKWYLINLQRYKKRISLPHVSLWDFLLGFRETFSLRNNFLRNYFYATTQLHDVIKVPLIVQFHYPKVIWNNLFQVLDSKTSSDKYFRQRGTCTFWDIPCSWWVGKYDYQKFVLFFVFLTLLCKKFVCVCPETSRGQVCLP